MAPPGTDMKPSLQCTIPLGEVRRGPSGHGSDSGREEACTTSSMSNNIASQAVLHNLCQPTPTTQQVVPRKIKTWLPRRFTLDTLELLALVRVLLLLEVSSENVRTEAERLPPHFDLLMSRRFGRAHDYVKLL